MAAGGSQYSVNGRSHYERNRRAYIDRATARRKSNKAYIKKLKQEGACVDCGIQDWRVLDFDHVTGKKDFSISIGAGRGLSLERLHAEIAKCELRCSNCHRIRTIGDDDADVA